jgi:hypothetical protein
MGWATLLAIFSKTHLATLPANNNNFQRVHISGASAHCVFLSILPSAETLKPCAKRKK